MYETGKSNHSNAVLIVASFLEKRLYVCELFNELFWSGLLKEFVAVYK